MKSTRAGLAVGFAVAVTMSAAPSYAADTVPPGVAAVSDPVAGVDAGASDVTTVDSSLILDRGIGAGYTSTRPALSGTGTLGADGVAATGLSAADSRTLTSADSVDAVASTGSESVAAAASYDYFNCVLYPSVIHLRTSSSRNTVGAKPYTSCTQGVPSKITHTSTLYKARWLGLNWQAMVTKSNSNTNSRTLTLKTVEWACQNRNNSNFIQRTSGTSLQLGRTFYSSVSTTKSKQPCGN